MRTLKARRRKNVLVSIIMNTICVFFVMIGLGGFENSKLPICLFCLMTGIIFGTIGMFFDRRAREAKKDMIRYYIHRYPYVLSK